MREDRRRRDGLVPSPRRPGDLRGAGAARAGLLLALSAGRGAGQFRQHRRRQRRRLPLHRSAHDRRRPPPDGGHRRGLGRLARQLLRRHQRAGRDALGRPEPARQRRAGHRGRHGDLGPAAQHRRTLRRRALSHRPSGRRDRGADPIRAGSGFPDRRHRHRRSRVHRRDLPDRPRRLSAARPLGEGGHRPRRLGRRRHRDPLRRAEVAPDRADRQPPQREEAAAARRRARRVDRGRAHRARAAQPRGRARDADGVALPADRARDPHFRQHERAGRRRHAEGRLARRGAAAMARPSPDGARAPLAAPAGGDRPAARTARRHDRRLPQPRRGDPHRPRGGRPEGGAEGPLRPDREPGHLRARHAAAQPAPARGDGSCARSRPTSRRRRPRSRRCSRPTASSGR